MSNNKHAFKDTLNLPSTPFPMKANLNQQEPKRLEQWKKQKIYDHIQSLLKDAPSFIFHDGPPYANGDIHIGHLLNKVLKDIVVRSQMLLGCRCEFIPGWDCHGLPIEHKVLSEMSSEKKQKLANLSPDQERLAIRNECKKYAEKYIRLQSNQMKRLLTLADYESPYLTFQPSYESKVLDVFSTMIKEGLVFRQKKPVHWSIANQTALAEAELEYIDKTSPSIAVSFEIASHPFNVSGPVYAVIWTTTPWTLPANAAIAYGDHVSYTLATINDQPCIVASNRLDYLKTVCTVSSDTPIQSSELSGLIAKHPFIDQSSPLLSAPFVTTDDGTGLVHIAPGHGTDDYILGQTHGLPPYSPVRSDGTFDDTVPDWLQFKSIWDANSVIINHLKSIDALIFHDDHLHSYPHDWRSKTPVIFRSTDQWFIGVDTPLKSSNQTLRQMATSAIDADITFHPASGQARLRGMLESRPDWCISRQRAWGLPIPAFKDANGTVLLTEKSVQHIAMRVGHDGSDIWFRETAGELLSGYEMNNDPMAPADFDVVSAEKLNDIFDVWFESGSSWHAVLQQRQDTPTADLYLEGSDQHRGWFHLSLLSSLAIHQKPPFKSLLTHGFIVDKDGRKMSKSAGNALTVDSILSTHGAEVTRWWVSSLSVENDIKVDASFFKDAGDLYRKIRNTLRFILSNLHGFPTDLPHCFELASGFAPHSIDAYALSLLSDCEKTTLDYYNSYQFKDATMSLYQFCNDTLSSFYLSAIKDRLYCDAPTSERRHQSQITLRIILDVLIRLLGPILPHTCDEVMEALHGPEATLQGLGAHRIKFQTSAPWDTVMSTRKVVLKLLEDAKLNGIENSLDAGILIPDTLNLASFMADLPDIFGVSRVSIGSVSAPVVEDLRDSLRCERSWKRDLSVKEWPNGAVLSERDYYAINTTH